MTSKCRSVLVVDDDDDIREVTQMLLEHFGYEVLVAADGTDALEQLHEGARPSLILLDLMMPGMDGLEFRAAQLRDPALAELPVVAVSGASSIASEAEAKGLRVIRKPLVIQQLLAAIDQHCSA